MFQKIVSLAEDVVELDLESTAGRSNFCIDMALVGPLFKVSSISNIFPMFRDLASFVRWSYIARKYRL